MKKYTVVWEHDALDGAAECWLSAPDRRAVAKACDAIDAALAADPRTNGEPLPEGLWSIVVPPLVAVYSIDEEADGMILVHAARFARVGSS